MMIGLIGMKNSIRFLADSRRDGLQRYRRGPSDGAVLRWIHERWQPEGVRAW